MYNTPEAKKEHAKSIVAHSGCHSLGEYAAKHIKWDPSARLQARFLAYSELQSTTSRVVLEALYEKGLVSKDYHHKCYVASRDLATQVSGHGEIALQRSESEIYSEAYHILQQTRYPTLEEYAACEIEWEKAINSETVQYVARHEPLTAAQMTVLNALKSERQVVQHADGYYRRDFIAAGELLKLVAPVVPEMQEMRSFVEKLRSQPPSTGKGI